MTGRKIILFLTATFLIISCGNGRIHPEKETSVNKRQEGITLSEYNKLIISDELVLVDFYADWCGPCQKMKPFISKIAMEMADELTLININVDDNIELSKRLEVAYLPTLKLYKNNKLVWEHIGFLNERKLRKVLKNHK